MVAERLRVPMRRVDHDSTALRPFRVRKGALADGLAVGALPLAERAWVSVIVRDGVPERIDGSTTLASGDEVHVLCEEHDEAAMRRIFEGG